MIYTLKYKYSIIKKDYFHFSKIISMSPILDLSTNIDIINNCVASISTCLILGSTYFLYKIFTKKKPKQNLEEIQDNEAQPTAENIKNSNLDDIANDVDKVVNHKYLSKNSYLEDLEHTTLINDNNAAIDISDILEENVHSVIYEISRLLQRINQSVLHQSFDNSSQNYIPSFFNSGFQEFNLYDMNMIKYCILAIFNNLDILLNHQLINANTLYILCNQLLFSFSQAVAGHPVLLLVFVFKLTCLLCSRYS